jgi:hypothetical protein
MLKYFAAKMRKRRKTLAALVAQAGGQNGEPWNAAMAWG